VLDPPGAETPAVRAVVRAYGGLAEVGTREWLERGSLSRDELRVLLTDALVALTRDTMPRLSGGTFGG
jgi:hypothetical protein